MRERPKLVTPVFVAITVASFAYFTSFGALLPVLPIYVESELGAGPVGVGLSVGAFAFTALFLRPFSGRLGDRYGRRLPLLAGAVIVLISLLGLVPSNVLWMLVGFRLLMGVGEALFFVAAASAINDVAPDERRGEAVSLFSLSLYGGFAVGPLIGETVMGDGRFDEVWLVSAGIAAVCVLLGLRVPDTRPPELRDASRPRVRVRIIHPAAVLPGSLLFASVWGFAGFSAFIALYARDLGFQRAGLVFLTYSVLMVLIRSVGARIPDILGAARAGRLSLGASAGGMAILGLWSTVPGLFVGSAVFACGQALAFPAFMSMAVRRAPASERGAVVGTFTAFFDLAWGLGAVSLGAINGVLGTEGMYVSAGGVAALGLVVLIVAARRTDLAATVEPEPTVAPAEM